MSLADYAMQRTALTNIHRSEKNLRKITRWYGKALRDARQELSAAKNEKNAVKQEVQSSIFQSVRSLQEARRQALANNNLAEAQEYDMQIDLIQQQAKTYEEATMQTIDDAIEKKTEAKAELEADQEAEKNSEETSKSFWQRVYEAAKQAWDACLKRMYPGSN